MPESRKDSQLEALLTLRSAYLKAATHLTMRLR